MRQKLGKYQLKEFLGSGTFGTVYRAIDEVLGREVAVKILKGSGIDDSELVTAFYDEARRSAQLSFHPNVAALIEIGEENDIYYLVMEYIPTSLDKLIQMRSSFTIEETLRIALQISIGLAHIHTQLIHRDVKPANILLTNALEVKLTDFGLSRALESSTGVGQSVAGGTYAYMPHEQINGDPIGKDADVYAVGITMYEMLAGKWPFFGRSPLDWYNKHRQDSVPNFPAELKIPDEVYALICKALEKERSRRYRDANEFRIAVSEVLDALERPKGLDGRVTMLIESGDTYLLQGDVQRACDDFAEVISIDPGNSEAFNKRGHCWHLLEDYEEAVADYTKSIELRPGYAVPHYNRGRAYIQEAKLELWIDQSFQEPSPRVKGIIGLTTDNFRASIQKAVEDLSVAIGLNPGLGDAYNQRGMAYSWIGEYDGAISDMTEAIRLSGNNPDEYVNRGDAYFEIGEYQLSHDDYQEAVELDPDNSEFLYKRGKSFLVLGEYGAALADFTEAFSFGHKYRTVAIHRGMALHELGDYNQAISAYTQALDLPDREDSRYSEIEFGHGYILNKRGDSWHALGEYPKAIVDQTESIKRHPDSSDAFVSRGCSWNELGEYEKAVEDYTKAVELDDRSSAALVGRAAAYNGLSEHRKAVSDYTGAIDLIPNNADFFYKRGISYFRLTQYQDALEDYAKATEIRPNFGQALEGQTGCYIKLKLYTTAIRCCEEILQLGEPGLNYSAHMNRAQCYSNLSMHKESVEDYTNAILINSKIDEPYYRRGISHHRLKLYRPAIRDFNAALDIRPKVPSALFQRGLAYKAIQDYKAALNDFNEAILLRPRYARAIFNRGMVLFGMGERDKAIEDYNEAIRVRPNYAAAYFERGSAMAEQGEHGQAVEDFTEAINYRDGFIAALESRRDSYTKLGMNRFAERDKDLLQKLKSLEQGT